LPFVATKSNVASTKSNVASTMLPVASTSLQVWTGLNGNFFRLNARLSNRQTSRGDDEKRRCVTSYRTRRLSLAVKQLWNQFMQIRQERGGVGGGGCAVGGGLEIDPRTGRRSTWSMTAKLRQVLGPATSEDLTVADVTDTTGVAAHRRQGCDDLNVSKRFTATIGTTSIISRIS